MKNVKRRVRSNAVLMFGPLPSGLKCPRHVQTAVVFYSLACVIAVLTLGSSTLAQNIAYDNLSLPHTDGDLFLPGPAPDFFDLFAQPFELGDNNAISSVSLQLARWDGTTGPVSGQWQFSIWDDNGDRPGQPVGDLGSIDVSTLANVKPDPPKVLATVTLDSSVTGLIPSERYYVVGDVRGLQGLTEDQNIFLRDAVMTPFLPHNRETSGANHLWISHVKSGTDWEPIERRWLQMSVEATTVTNPTNSVLFDNLAVEPEDYVNVLGNNRRHAQQFLMDGRVSVEEVTVSLSRQGSASGSMAFEIWSDNDFGSPMEKVGDLGTIEDVSQISTEHTDFIFDQRVAGLNSSENYWIVANYSGLTGALTPDNSIGWTVVLSDAGANGTANAHGSVNSGETWIDLAGAFEIDGPFKFKMSVVGGNFGDFNEDGMLSAEDIDALTTAITAGFNEKRFDLNEDNEINQADRAFWVKDIRSTWFGDANLDGEFNSGDLVDLFAAAEYEDGVPMNSTWTTGDFDGDGDFGSGDLVAAFKDNGYEQGQRPAVAVVPEPSALLLLMMAGLSGFAIRRRRAGL